jgi:hypothetical protein
MKIPNRLQPWAGQRSNFSRLATSGTSPGIRLLAV